MRDYVYIGSSPYDEDCAQVGSSGYHDLSKLELAAFRQGIINKVGEPPEGAYLTIKEGEVVCAFDNSNEKATEYAYRCESDAPKTWEECGVAKPSLQTSPEFAASELIAPIEGGQTWNGSEVTECDLKDVPPIKCQNKIVNEFFDAATAMGPWANLCPACFSRYGKGLGTGLGQRYKKATDGKFYKVEG